MQAARRHAGGVQVSDFRLAKQSGDTTLFPAGINSISNKIRNRNVLLVLDNIEEGHAKWLIPDECSPGSLIIVTSRSQQALEKAGCILHRVDLLPEPQARELFLQKVQSIPSDADASPLLSEMLTLCNGLPLSLKVMD